MIVVIKVHFNLLKWVLLEQEVMSALSGIGVFALITASRLVTMVSQATE